MIEEWRDILGYEGLYQVSSLGNVKSLKRHYVPEDRLLTLTINPQSGYVMVTLVKDGSQKTKRVHVLVCEAFHGVRPDGKMALHGDGDKLNNAKTNLRWGTHQENMDDRTTHGTGVRGVQSPHAALTLSQVKMIRRRYKRFSRSNGAVALARELGVSATCITNAAKGATYVD